MATCDMDRKVIAGAKGIHLPTAPDALAHLVAPADTARLASALVRVSLDRHAGAVLRDKTT
jgi:hypothetical protein